MDHGLALKLTLLNALGKESWDALALLGEALVLVPVAAFIGFHLWQRGMRSETQAWGTGIALCIMTVGLLKLGIPDFKWTLYGHTFHASGFPSGHAAMATVFWGGLALIARDWRLAPLLLLPIPIVLVTVLVLWWHHTLDVVAGVAIGVTVLSPMLLRAPRRWRRSIA